MTLREVIQAHNEWCELTFPLATSVGALNHALLEIDEVISEKDRQKIIIEYADVIFCVLDAMRRESIEWNYGFFYIVNTARLKLTLLDECKEIIHSLIKEINSRDKFSISLNSNFIILLRSITTCLTIQGFKQSDFIKAMEFKLNKNKSRTWIYHKDGYYFHDKSKTK